MRWVCPRCHNQVSVALIECPYCAERDSEENAAGTRAAPPLGAPPPVAEAPPQPPGEPQVEPPPPPPPTPRPVVRPRRAAVPPPAPTKEEKTEEETPFWRGVRMGVGFALSVAVILFLLSLVLFWLRQIGWQPWFENLPR